MAIKDLFKLKKKESSPQKPIKQEETPQPSQPAQYSQPPANIHSNSHTSSTNSQNQGPFVDSSDNVPSTSTSFTSQNTDFTTLNSNIYTQYNNLNQKENVPKELVPIVTLINCQNARIYLKNQLYLNVEKNDGGAEQDLSYQLVDAILKGNQLILYKEGLESSFKPISINLLEATVKLVQPELSLILSSSNKLAYHLKFTSIEEVQSWLSAIKLSNFEFNNLNQSYTASLLSSKATLLSDVHVLMAETRYQTEEWVNIKFSKNSNWIRSYCVITPGDRFKKKNAKTGSIQFYTSSKANKKHLICSINAIDSCYAVYPNHVDLIDDSTLLKLNGDLNIYNLGLNAEDIDDPSSPLSRTNSIKSSSPPPSAGGFRSRSNSNTPRSHLRSTSISSIGSSKSLKGWSVNNTSLYVLPRTHNAVKNFETLIRYLLPLYDSFQLYGRPKRLISEKNDQQSLLFGLPSLPHTEYLTTGLANQSVQSQWSSIVRDDENFNFNSLFATKIQSLYQSPNGFKGFGDLKTTLTNEVTFEDPMVKFNNYSIPDFEIDPQQTPKYAFSISDLPANATNDGINNTYLGAPLSAGPQSAGGAGTTQGHLRIPSASSNLQNLSLSNSSQNLNALNSNNVPLLKSPRLRSSSNNFGSSLNGGNSYSNLNSLVSPSPQSNSLSNSPNPNSQPPTAITAHQAAFKNQRDNTNSIPAVA